jgi:asparagine synthase (glutamine-hydrolysing)
MTIGADSLVLGKARFPDVTHEVGHMADAHAAWSGVPAGDPREFLAGVAGSFAVGLTGPNGRTVLAVDRFATQTLCYRQVQGQLRFAARADELADPSPALDSQAIYDYLLLHAVASPRTIFKEVHRLPPAHCAVWEDGRLTVQPYWVARFDDLDAAPLPQLKTQFRELLRHAVRQQLGAGIPACFLSGGTDSSTVAGTIAEVTGQAPYTYSIGFDAAGYDEVEYARIAARHFGTTHHEYYITPDDLVAGIPQVAAHYDQPFGNSSALPAYYCERLARQDGVTKLLAGDGGDELFGGNSRYAKQRIFDWYGMLPQALRESALEPIFGRPAMSRAPLLRKAASYIEQARIPMPDRLQIYNLLLRLQPTAVLTADFLSRVDLEAPLRQQRDVWSQAQADSLINRSLAFDWRYTLAENDLPKVRGTAELAGLDVGFPLLDDGLVDFSLHLPSQYKLKGLRLRWFFKEALRDFLPEAIITKKKHGFGLPFGAWTQRHAGLRALAADSVKSLAARNLVREDFVHRLLESLVPQHPGYYGELLWILMMLEQWLRHHAPRWRVEA